MKTRKLLFSIGFSVVAILLVSWGVVGHSTVATIAERHLTANASAGVKALLGSESMANVASWADGLRNDPDYKETAPWHYLNLPLGLSYAEFEKAVKEKTEDNVYKAVLAQEKILADPAMSREKRADALKFIIHFVGDLHQPMHISRAEDKGGNTIQLNYEGKGTNLHSLWDSKLIEHTGMSYEQLAVQYDHATPAQVKQWQNDPLMRWIWESYQISSKLYAEVDAMKSRSIDDSYYQAHIGIIQQRLDQAGIRLAGILNTIFKNGPIGLTNAETGMTAPKVADTGNQAAVNIDVHDAAQHMNQAARVTGTVYGYKELEGLTLVNVGAAYPDQLMTVVLKKGAMSLASSLDGKKIVVTGKIIEYKGKPEIVVTDPANISIVQ